MPQPPDPEPEAQIEPAAPEQPASPHPEAWFATTHWSVVLAARSHDEDRARAALDALCRTYWYPLYSFARRRGCSPHDAEDLVQEFFARLLAKDYLRAAQPEHGRFRTFLIMALKRFLANEWDRARARKRGGGIPDLPLDAAAAERRYAREPDAAASAELAFDRQWALTLLDRTLAALRAECERGGKGREFAVLGAFLAPDAGLADYRHAAARLGMTEAAARMAVHRLRRRFRAIFRDEIAGTVASPAAAREEIRYLLDVLSR